ncbi:peptidase S16 lon domain protein [Nitrosococcus halophilus Nc 4]|uniref:endopeptidase La n=1 Tax=Nitrosococcus halophilus (strain Nc4) TaxID=472759 RepID=D5C2B2_NITHN|nr:ATP-binding protein [Nitrosococcus halophilus]ADE14771.1 peptidase S16 lon domain protein [Nitrosococcus halophilus Nc 4]
MKYQPLAPEQLYHDCDESQFTFTSTEELEDRAEIVGQSRALEAIDFGIGIQHKGYNLYLAGSHGLGKYTAVRQVLDKRVVTEPVPSDWCYVNNFEHPYRPQTLQLPPGHGQHLQQDMAQLVEDLVSALRAAFQSEEYRARAQEISDEFEAQGEEALSELAEQAQKEGILLLRTPAGYTLAPAKDSQPMGPEDFEELSEGEKKRIQELVEKFSEKLKETVRKIPTWRRESRARFKALEEEVTQATVEQPFEELQQKYSNLPQVMDYLQAVKQDMVENVNDFVSTEQSEAPFAETRQEKRSGKFRRYQVNVLVDNSDCRGAPVIYEDNPTYQNLVGRLEHIARLGTLQTDFTLIKPGALHRANGGYLILDARKVLTRPFAWEGLKRVLQSQEIRLESLEQMLSLASTISLEPAPIPLDVKVVLTGERVLYYLLKEYDPEFNLLFKVTADFSEDFDRSPEGAQRYAHFIGNMARQGKLRPLDRQGVVRVIEHSARVVGDGEKLSLHMEGLKNLLQEADYFAGKAASNTIGIDHVQQAIDAKIRRSDQLRERVYQEILRETLLIDTEGTEVAQVNGLSVLQLGDFAFGRPSRITATAFLGEGQVVDIERETELGGPIHSKGVLILSSYLAHRYAQDCPLFLSASLVFEQSYGMVEGDSASVAELCALLSALAKVPIRQSLAVTGSVNQRGVVQAIGGVNEKIEGFFDVCRARGLDGEQGVIIPRANVKHLMLRHDVVAAAEKGQFRVYPVDTVDEVLELLTGMDAGIPDSQGHYPEGTVNGRVQARLKEFSHLRQQFGKPLSRNEGDGGVTREQ